MKHGNGTETQQLVSSVMWLWGLSSPPDQAVSSCLKARKSVRKAAQKEPSSVSSDTRDTNSVGSSASSLGMSAVKGTGPVEGEGGQGVYDTS